MGKFWEQVKSDFMRGYTGEELAQASMLIGERDMPEPGGMVSGVGTGGMTDPEGNLAIRHIPAGTPEPEKTRLQKLVDLIYDLEKQLEQRDQIILGQDQEIQAWKDRCHGLGHPSSLIDEASSLIDEAADTTEPDMEPG